ncbi:serine/threonine-protein kinase [Pseudonocardia acidicola]|uniref:non-specific serine/threonine protein kinase n=1 Tax=Pseudonocardia acidicola TaxID=2724939 RepID=A0ABX1SKM6_9PSEU|nr:serine/threonine-protein kinase [Pseudonocardia acidicola]NMI02112.1 serine/threonine protein kinase [Pseudonocardia acidicola]
MVERRGDSSEVIASRYILDELVGSGSSACVYRAWDEPRARPVAVKLFHPGVDACTLNRQRRELRVLGRLHHPGLVRLYSGGVEKGRLYVVTEFVEGPTLGQRLLDGPLPGEVACRFGARLAAGLDHVHAQGVVHRDVKPGNVLLGRGGVVKLTDFGIAKVMGFTPLTEPGGVVGTAPYLAPEQVRGDEVGPPADVYALGLLLLEAVTGVREYPGGGVESAVARLYRPPRIPPGLSDCLTESVAAATAADPEDRPLAADLAGMLSGSGG